MGIDDVTNRSSTPSLSKRFDHGHLDLPADLERGVGPRDAERPRKVTSLHNVGRKLGKALDRALELREALLERVGCRLLSGCVLLVLETVMARKSELLDLLHAVLELLDPLGLAFDPILLVVDERHQMGDGGLL